MHKRLNHLVFSGRRCHHHCHISLFLDLGRRDRFGEGLRLLQRQHLQHLALLTNDHAAWSDGDRLHLASALHLWYLYYRSDYLQVKTHLFRHMTILARDKSAIPWKMTNLLLTQVRRTSSCLLMAPSDKLAKIIAPPLNLSQKSSRVHLIGRNSTS